MRAPDISKFSHLRRASFIDGAWLADHTKPALAVTNPANGEQLAEVGVIGAREAEIAVRAASRAFRSWKGKTAQERADLLKALHSAVLEQKQELSTIMTCEQGKPLHEARAEIEYGANYIEWYAEEARRIYGKTIPSPNATRRILVSKEPVGVCAAITPWNFPFAMLARKLAPALASGCTFIARPASETPLTALALASLAQGVGLPAGVFNVIIGAAQELSNVLLSADAVRKMSFTGSTEVGKLLMRESSNTLKRLTLELGGNAPCIVCADANLEKAADGVLAAKFRNSGQTCICVNRVLVDSSVVDEFLSCLTRRCAALRTGPGWEEGTHLGPLINDAAASRLGKLLAESVAHGARVLCGGPPVGRFMPATVVSNVPPHSPLLADEIFGPVCPVATFEGIEDAIVQSNSTPYGLAAYLFTENIRTATQITEALEFGMIGVNTTSISLAEAPFGGVKHSGFGREGGHEGIEEYLNLKYVTLDVG